MTWYCTEYDLPDMEFVEIEKELPMNFISGIGNYDLRIGVHGKIKVEELRFM